jgi:hypothetical protein
LRARLRTFSPPGSTPSASLPAAAHSAMTDQIRSRPALIAASSLRTSSLASMTPLIGRPLSSVRVSSSAPLANG